MNQQQPRSRRVRRQDSSGPAPRYRSTTTGLRGPIAWLTNPKLFVAMGIIFAAGIILGLMGGLLTGTSNRDPANIQANEAPDVPVNDSGTVTPGTTPTPAAAIKRYTAAPPLTIDTSVRYVATLKTAKGEIQIELDPSQAPESVNSFVFLARDGYYDKTPFMQVATYQDGRKFYAQAGDPTRTGLGTPGYFVKKENTSAPFVRGAVGMCGTADNSNGGQFFISYVDDPSVKGCTIFGKVVNGLDVLDKLTLLQVTNGRPTGSGDEIQAVTIAQR